MREIDFLDSIRGKELNFLIGSGASAGAVPTLWVDTLKTSFEELLKSTEFTEEDRPILNYIWFQLWISKTQILKEDIELTDIHRQYDNFISNIIKILNEEGFDKPKRANIFTTNYDTFFELAFDKVASNNRLTYFNDGSNGFIKKYVSTENYYKSASYSGINYNFERSIPSINLVKLHGSVTWKKEFDNNKIEVNLNNKLFKDILSCANSINSELKQENMEELLLSNLENYILRELTNIQELKELFRRLSDDLKDNINEFNSLYKKLPVVNPTDRKFSETVFEQHYYQMIRMLSFELERKDSVLIVFGFSFADQHILEIVRRAMTNPTLQIYIIAYNEVAMKDIKEKVGIDIRVLYFPTDFKNKDNGETKGNFAYFNFLLNGGVKNE